MTGPKPPRRPLSVRELEVVRHLADGHTYDEVAGVLYLSKTTVKSRAARARKIVGARNTAQLCVLAVRSGQLQ